MFVSNTLTLVLLAKINCLEKFIQVSPLIAIPGEVKAEAMFEKDSYYARYIMRLINSKKIVVQKASEQKVKQIMAEFRLNTGEAAAYALFDRKKHKAILTDDGELIKLCKLEGVPFISSMAVIISLHEKGKLAREAALEKLKELNTIGRYSSDLYEYFKAEVK
ncbi:hypothetical protein HYX10_02190 [Candidatus Woesearchaeota archaeon]|nr:hypothetical protein [Candidatus Woesearchaeota archaeon]